MFYSGQFIFYDKYFPNRMTQFSEAILFAVDAGILIKESILTLEY